MEIDEKYVRRFIRQYKFEYWLGKIIGEELFDKMFGYLNPNVPFEELTGENIKFLMKNYEDR